MFKVLTNLFKKAKLKKQISNSMDEYSKKMKRYETLTKAEFVNLPDVELFYAAISWIFKQTQVVTPEQLMEALSKMPIACQTVIAVNAVDGEVNNGGFNQYYANRSHILPIEGFVALAAIGAYDLAQIAEKADILYNSIKDDLEKYNDGTIESFSKSYIDNPLNALDEKYYEASETEDIVILLNKYIRANINDFGSRCEHAN